MITCFPIQAFAETSSQVQKSFSKMLSKSKSKSKLSSSTNSSNNSSKNTSVEKPATLQKSQSAAEVQKLQVLQDVEIAEPKEEEKVNEEFEADVPEAEKDLESGDDDYESAEEGESNEFPPGVIDFDAQNAGDVNQCSEYARKIFAYYKTREPMFRVFDYMKTTQDEVTVQMRAILVDWLVEVQESFELNHETLYTAVKMMDIYLSRKKKVAI